MKINLCLGAVLLLALSGCSNFQYSKEERGVAFPLRPCDSTALKFARQQLTTDKSLEFSDKWVCVTESDVAHDSAINEKGRDEKEALDSLSERQLREHIEAPFLAGDAKRPALGIALAGGGSKASAFGIGVLAGLADTDLLDTANYISSVSGGSYAAYFHYAHHVLPRRSNDRERPTSKQLYWDCVLLPEPGATTPDTYNAIRKFGGCKSQHLQPMRRADESAPPDNRYQAFLRCQQDMLRPGVCSTQTTTRDLGMSALAILGTVTLFPVSNVATTLFDWGYGVSPSQSTYRNGIGVGFGTTSVQPGELAQASGGRRLGITCAPESGAIAKDCDSQGLFVTPNGHELTFQELRAGLLASRQPGEVPLPFWIINAAAPRYRSAFGWWTLGSKDSTNSDMFEMTAVSHGSGRYGYVSAPVSLHRMNVLDAVGASAAFLDANQTVVLQPWRGLVGVGLHLLNLDWGSDIANYNVSDERRQLHKAMPFPFYWLDSSISKLSTKTPAETNRIRSSFIRLIDGGNGENLGVYSLIKRKVKTILVVDASQDSKGQFLDICALAGRFENAPKSVASHLYIPGLQGFEDHCKKLNLGKAGGYDLHAWKFDFPVLAGCLRVDKGSDSPNQCADLQPNDFRLLIVKPALNLERFVRTQTLPPNLQDKSSTSYRKLTRCLLPDEGNGPGTSLLNCDTSTFLLLNWSDDRRKCQVFPQHSTVFMTIDSSATLFGAYRELARQYVHQAAPLLKGLTADAENSNSVAEFEKIAREQATMKFAPTEGNCKSGTEDKWAQVMWSADTPEVKSK